MTRMGPFQLGMLYGFVKIILDVEDTNRSIQQDNSRQEDKKKLSQPVGSNDARCRPSAHGDHGDVALRGAGSEHGGWVEVGLDGLSGLFQPSRFYDSTKCMNAVDNVSNGETQQGTSAGFVLIGEQCIVPHRALCDRSPAFSSRNTTAIKQCTVNISSAVRKFFLLPTI